ncbi:MAG: hypothetical protein Q4B63_04890 [Clostridium perfringens]|nr:hypothetical protein [Clostridium perfringens]
MGRVISLIISILILILIFRFVWLILPYAIIVGICLFIYFKYIKPMFNKNKNHENLHEHENYYNQKTTKEEEDMFTSPIVDVDYKDVDENDDKKEIL